MSDTHTPRKRKLEELIDLNDGFCQTPPSAKKPRKNYTLDYKLRIVEASKNSVSQRAFAASQNLDEKTLRQINNFFLVKFFFFLNKGRTRIKPAFD